jgi:hypothetical protein
MNRFSKNTPAGTLLVMAALVVIAGALLTTPGQAGANQEADHPAAFVAAQLDDAIAAYTGHPDDLSFCLIWSTCDVFQQVHSELVGACDLHHIRYN